MTTLRKPVDSSGPGYNPFIESVIKIFPTAVASAMDMLRNPEVATGLLDLGATPEGLDEAVAFYDRYLCSLMSNEANEDAFSAFEEAGIQPGDLSFLLFQSLVAASFMSSYHEAVCEVSKLEAIWVKQNIYALQQYMAAHHTDLCPCAVRLTGRAEQPQQE